MTQNLFVITSHVKENAVGASCLRPGVQGKGNGEHKKIHYLLVEYFAQPK